VKISDFKNNSNLTEAVLKILFLSLLLAFLVSALRPSLELLRSAKKIYIEKQEASIVLGNSYSYARRYSKETSLRGNLLIQGYMPWLFVYYVYPKAVYYAGAVPDKNRAGWLKQRHIYSVIDSNLELR
jgi:hypothetical protein